MQRSAQWTRAAAAVAKAKRVVAFTGAGMSAESGIATFRGAGGLWDEFSPGLYGNPLGLAFVSLFRPGRFSGFVRAVFTDFLQASPNDGHRALSKLSEIKETVTVVTQNVDGLHQEAGSDSVLEVHGSLLRLRCQSCGMKRELPKEEMRGVVNAFIDSGWLLPRLFSKRGMPTCTSCGGIERPDVVLFGESLPMDVFTAAGEACADCDVLLVVGTSATVQPAASLPLQARRAGAFIIEINPYPAMEGLSDVCLKGSAADILPQLCTASQGEQ